MFLEVKTIQFRLLILITLLITFTKVRWIEAFSSPELIVLSPESGKRILTDKVVLVVLIQNEIISKDLSFCVDQIDGKSQPKCWNDYGFGGNGYFVTALDPAGSTFYSFFKIYLQKQGSRLAEASFYFTHLSFDQCIPLNEPRNIHLAIAFNQGLDLLDMMLFEVADKVESIALVETSKSPMGETKALQYQENKSRFKKYWPMIHHHALTSFPLLSSAQEEYRLWWDGLVQALQHADDNDLVILVSGEEIPSSEAILRLQSCSELTFPTILLMDWYLYNLNWHAPESWGLKLQQAPVAVTVAQLREWTPTVVRHFLNATRLAGIAAETTHQLPQAQRDGTTMFQSARPQTSPFSVSVMVGGGWHFQNFKDEEDLTPEDDIFQATGLASWELSGLKSIKDKYFQFVEHESPQGMPRAIAHNIDRFAYLLPNLNGFETEHKEALEFWIMQAAVKERRIDKPKPEEIETENADSVTLTLDCSLSTELRDSERESVLNKYGQMLGNQFWESLVQECSKLQGLQPTSFKKGFDSTMQHVVGDSSPSQVAKIDFLLPSIWTLEVKVGDAVLYFQMDLKAPFDVDSVERFCSAIFLDQEGCEDFKIHAHEVYKERTFYGIEDKEKEVTQTRSINKAAKIMGTLSFSSSLQQNDRSLPQTTDLPEQHPTQAILQTKALEEEILEPNSIEETSFSSLDHVKESGKRDDLFVAFHKLSSLEQEADGKVCNDAQLNKSTAESNTMQQDIHIDGDHHTLEIQEGRTYGMQEGAKKVAAEAEETGQVQSERARSYEPYSAYIGINSDEPGMQIFCWTRLKTVSDQLCNSANDEDGSGCFQKLSVELLRKQMAIYELEFDDFQRNLKHKNLENQKKLTDDATAMLHQLAQDPRTQTICQVGLGDGKELLSWLLFSENTQVVLFDPLPDADVLTLLQQRFPGRLLPMAGDLLSSLQSYNNFFSTRRCNILLILSATTGSQDQQLSPPFQQQLQAITNITFHQLVIALEHQDSPDENFESSFDEHTRLPNYYMLSRSSTMDGAEHMTSPFSNPVLLHASSKPIITVKKKMNTHADDVTESSAVVSVLRIGSWKKDAQ